MKFIINAGICLFLLFLPIIVDKFILRFIEIIISKISINIKSNKKKLNEFYKKYPKKDVKELKIIKKLNDDQFRQIPEYWKQLYKDYLICSEKFNEVKKINFNSVFFIKIINIISYAGIAIYPILYILIAKYSSNIMDFYLVPGAILGIILFFNYSGGHWQHQTKSGKADMRYSRESNKYIPTEIGDMGIRSIICLVLLVISFIIANMFFKE